MAVLLPVELFNGKLRASQDKKGLPAVDSFEEGVLKHRVL
jgi:hypothetical protein